MWRCMGQGAGDGGEVGKVDYGIWRTGCCIMEVVEKKAGEFDYGA